MHRYKSLKALAIQVLFRGHSARKEYLVLRTREAGSRLYAARVVLRAWLRCRDQRRFDALKEAWEVEKSTELLMELNDERIEIQEDIDKYDVKLEKLRKKGAPRSAATAPRRAWLTRRLRPPRRAQKRRARRTRRRARK